MYTAQDSASMVVSTDVLLHLPVIEQRRRRVGVSPEYWFIIPTPNQNYIIYVATVIRYPVYFSNILFHLTGLVLPDILVSDLPNNRYNCKII